MFPIIIVSHNHLSLNNRVSHNTVSHDNYVSHCCYKNSLHTRNHSPSQHFCRATRYHIALRSSLEAPPEALNGNCCRLLLLVVSLGRPRACVLLDDDSRPCSSQKCDVTGKERGGNDISSLLERCIPNLLLSSLTNVPGNHEHASVW